MEILKGIKTNNGIIVQEGIVVYDGILSGTLAAGSAVIPLDHPVETSGIWTGSYQTKTPSGADTYEKLSITSASMGTTSAALIDNSDCSFTNDSGGTLYLRGIIVVSFHNNSVSYEYNFTGGTDNSGSDAAIITDSGMWRVMTAVPSSAPVQVMFSYQIALLDGKSVFPMWKNYTDTSSIYIGNVKHYVEPIAGVA